MKKTLILTTLIVFLITASAFSYDFNEETGLYEFTPDELSTLISEMKKKDDIIDKQDEVINSLEDEKITLETTIKILEEDINNYKEEIQLRDDALDEADETIDALQNENATLKERIRISDELIKAEQQSGLDFKDELKLIVLLYAGKTILE